MRFPQVSDKVQEAPANALRSVFARIGQVLLITDRMKKKSGESEAESAGTPESAGRGPESGEAAAQEGAQEGASAAAAPAKPADVTAAAPAPEAGAPVEAGGAAGTSATTEAAVEGASGKVAPARKPAARKPAAKTSAAKRGTTTGNVRVLPEDEAKTTPVTARKPRPRKPTSTGTTTPAAAAPAVAAPEAAAPEVVAAPEGPVSTDAAPLPNYDTLTVASLRARLRNLSVDQVRALISYEQAHANRAEVITMLERRVAKLETPES